MSHVCRRVVECVNELIDAQWARIAMSLSVVLRYIPMFEFRWVFSAEESNIYSRPLINVDVKKAIFEQ